MRIFVLFRSSFAWGNAPSIAHETTDRKRTFCGRDVATAEAIEEDDRDAPDCLICSRIAEKKAATT